MIGPAELDRADHVIYMEEYQTDFVLRARAIRLDLQGTRDHAHFPSTHPSQTVEPVMTSFPNLPPNGDRGLIDLNNETLDWLVYLNSSSEANVFIGKRHTPVQNVMSVFQYPV